MTIIIITIPQIDGTRFVALSQQDASRVRADRTMIDAVRPLGVADRYRDGSVEYGLAGPLWVNVDGDVKRELRRALRSD